MLRVFDLVVADHSRHRVSKSRVSCGSSHESGGWAPRRCHDGTKPRISPKTTSRLASRCVAASIRVDGFVLEVLMVMANEGPTPGANVTVVDPSRRSVEGET